MTTDPLTPGIPRRPGLPGRGHTQRPRREPTVRQWRAVRDAIERFTGRGRWACFPTAHWAMPPFDLRWVDAEAPPPGFPVQRAAGLTALYRNHAPVIYLRLDASPRDLLATCLHELQHVVDAAAILGGAMSETTYELRACATSERLVALGPLQELENW